MPTRPSGLLKQVEDDFFRAARVDQRRSDAGGAAVFTGAVPNERIDGGKQRAVLIIQRLAEADTTGILIVQIDIRLECVAKRLSFPRPAKQTLVDLAILQGVNNRYSEIAQIAHQVNDRHAAQRIASPRTPSIFSSESNGAHRGLARGMVNQKDVVCHSCSDRLSSPAPTFSSVNSFSFLNPTTSSVTWISPCEGRNASVLLLLKDFEHFHIRVRDRVRVVVGGNGPHVRFASFVIEAVNKVRRAFAHIDGFFVERRRARP